VVLTGRKSWISEKHCENCIRAEKKTQILCHKIEPNPSKDKAMLEGNNSLF
jgi:hypothetical protein